MKNEYYKILGISDNASIDEIRAAYKKLSKQWHPDVNKSPQATEMMQKINIAYSWLKKNHKPVFQQQNQSWQREKQGFANTSSSQPNSNNGKWANPYEKYRYAYGTPEFFKYFDENYNAMASGKLTDEEFLTNMM